MSLLTFLGWQMMIICAPKMNENLMGLEQHEGE